MKHRRDCGLRIFDFGIKPKSLFEFIGNIIAESPLLKVESPKIEFYFAY